MDTMKSRQLLTSFLACMALWSAPVYAKNKTDYAYAVQKQFKNLFNTLSVDNPKKQEYADAYDAFLQQYADFVNELDKLLTKGDRKSIRKARKMLINLVGKNVITNTEQGTYTNTIGITNLDVNTLKRGLRHKKGNLNRMKELYEKMKKAEKRMREDLQTLKTTTQSEGS